MRTEAVGIIPAASQEVQIYEQPGRQAEIQQGLGKKTEERDRKESVFPRIEVGDREDNAYYCFRRTTLGGSHSDQWLIGVSAKSLEDVLALLKRARQFQRAGVEMRRARL